MCIHMLLVLLWLLIKGKQTSLKTDMSLFHAGCITWGLKIFRRKSPSMPYGGAFCVIFPGHPITGNAPSREWRRQTAPARRGRSGCPRIHSHRPRGWRYRPGPVPWDTGPPARWPSPFSQRERHQRGRYPPTASTRLQNTWTPTSIVSIWRQTNPFIWSG